MVIVCQGYGAASQQNKSTTSCRPVGGLSCSGGSGEKLCPNFNYELLVDGVEFKDFTSISVNQILSALAAFTLNLGNPEGKNTNRFQQNSEIEFKASWGNRAPETIIKGFVKQRSFQSGVQRGISLSGIDYGDYMIRSKPWDADFKPLIYNNEKVSTILSRLISLTPQVKFKITKMSDEPRFDWVTDPTNNSILDEFKAVAEYGGYEWYIRGDTMYVREPKQLVAGSCTYDLVFGNPDDFAGILPDLPTVILLSSNVDEDAGDIKNVYKVVGRDDNTFAIEDNPISIQKYRGRFEGYYQDSRLTSVQTCSYVAKLLSQLNGVPRLTTGVNYSGNNNVKVGDVVGVGDLYKGFDPLTSPYVRMASITHNFGIRWDTQAQLGSLVRTLNDLIV